MSLKAIVIGTGWAGEGHTVALRDAGVDVIAMCGRTAGPAHATAEKLRVPNVRFDWRLALAEFSPDIVAITTPAKPHREMAIAAARAGCHVCCEKPLAINAEGAKAMLDAVENAGVKHAYASTSRYGPIFIHARSLIAGGLIGDILHIEQSCHAGVSKLLPYSWMHRLAEGGGLLNNGLPHLLGQLRQVTGGEVITATGVARQIIDRAPAGPRIHDFRESFAAASDPTEADKGTWHEADADMAFTLLAQLRLPDGRTADATIQASFFAAHAQSNYLAVHGSKGSLFLSGGFWAEDRIRCFEWKSGWREIEVPRQLIATLPPVADRVQRDWNQFYREFIAAVRGDGGILYPTFREGYIDAAIVEIVRQGPMWASVRSDAKEFSA